MIATSGVVRDPAGVVAHYGSPAGELAACVQGAGLVDRSELVAMEITGDAHALAQLVERASGWSLAPGGCAFAAGIWWCARSPECVIALAEQESGSALEAIAEADRGLERSRDLAAIGVVGKATLAVLSAVGAIEDPRAAPCFGPATVGGAGVELLLQSDHHAILLAAPSAARDVWDALEAAGRPFALCYVGAEALARFTLMERMLERSASVQRS